MPERLSTPDSMVNYVLDRISQINRQMAEPTIDDQEMLEREEAAHAYFGEDEAHFVEYCTECINTSRQAMTAIRKMQQECYQVYQEEEPRQYADKEDWQSRVVLPKPHSAVQFAKTQVRKAFSPQFLSIQNESNLVAAEFWKQIMQKALDESHANFRIVFPDATEMALAIGTSMEIVAYWDDARGLQYDLIEPWKIHRDPDAKGRDPQSGMYWIHEEYQDLWALAEGEKRGQYMHVGAVQDSLKARRPGSNVRGLMSQQYNPENPEMDAAREAERRKMLVSRNKFREMALVREFWGKILDRRGNLLLPNHTYTVAGRKVVSVGQRDAAGNPLLPGPVRSPYRTLRWPGVAFSPIPNLLRFDGRGIVQGVRSLWYWMCALMALHSDNLNWIVNPMGEINIQGLQDQSDIDIYPGHWFATKDTVSGQQVARTIDRRFITNEVLANLQYGSQSFEEGTFVTSTVKGLPGYRNEITFREVAQQMDQSRDMFSTLGENVEDGALHAIRAGMETIMANATMDDLRELVGDQDVQEVMAAVEQSGAPIEASPLGIPFPLLRGSFNVSGLTAVLKSTDVIRGIREVLLPLTGHPLFVPYLKPYQILHSLETRLDLRDEGTVVRPDEAQQIEQQQRQAQAQQSQMQQQLMEAQMAAEQQRLALEAQKLELEATKMALEARKMELDAEIQGIEAAVEVERIEAERAQLAQQIREQEATIQKITVEIGRIILQSQAIAEKLRMDQERIAIQARQAAMQLSIQAAQAASQIETQKAQRAALRNGSRNGSADD